MTFRSLPLLSSLFVGALAVFTAPVGAQTSTPTTTTTLPDLSFLPPVITGGPTIVYQLTFEAEEGGINYLPYESGYYVAPSAGGSGTLIVTKSKGLSKSVYTFTDFGELFVAQDGSKRRAVISCTAASNVSTTAFFAIGETTDTLKGDDPDISGDVYYAPTLNGWAISADSQADQLFVGSASTDSGVAGSSKVTFTFDDADTNNAAATRLSVAAIVKLIQTRMTSRGFTLATQNTPTSGSTSTGGTGTGSTGTGGTGTGGTGTGTSTSTIGPGDMLVYELSFRDLGESINWKNFEGGYYVSYALPTSSGTANSTGTILLKVRDSFGGFYTKHTNFGGLFVAKSRSERQGVMYASAVNSVSTTTFFAMGEARSAMRFDAPSRNASVYFARKLTGYAFSADSGIDLPFFGQLTDLGTGGASTMTATYDETRSKAANKARLTITSQVTLLEKELKAEGYLLLQ